jgi:hypothetical protein
MKTKDEIEQVLDDLNRNIVYHRVAIKIIDALREDEQKKIKEKKNEIKVD